MIALWFNAGSGRDIVILPPAEEEDGGRTGKGTDDSGDSGVWHERYPVFRARAE